MRERGVGQLVTRLIDSNPNPRVLSRCANCFKQIAMAYLKRKIARGSLNLNRIQLQLEDFAWDCIAGLFERDESGNFVQLQTYFQQYDLENMSDQEIYSACRRLVFSKVNDGIFRNFRTVDPALGKIIRNVKLAIQKHEDLVIESRKDMNRVIFDKQLNRLKPMMPVELLRIRLTHRLTSTMFISEALDTTYDIMTNHDQYRSEYPVVELSKILRYAYTQLNDNAEDSKQQVTPENPLYEEDISEFIEASIERVRNDMYDTYVTKDKLDPNTFDIYFQCVNDILSDLFIDKGKTSSYFDHLNKYLNEVSRSAYRENHRGYLEYLVKKARSELLHSLRKEL